MFVDFRFNSFFSPMRERSAVLPAALAISCVQLARPELDKERDVCTQTTRLSTIDATRACLEKLNSQADRAGVQAEDTAVKAQGRTSSASNRSQPSAQSRCCS
jgi:hypothetical protein